MVRDASIFAFALQQEAPNVRRDRFVGLSTANTVSCPESQRTLPIQGDEPLHEAIALGTRDRPRAIVLAALTTIGGLAPLKFETDLQARFLIPMGITIVFGRMIATLLVLRVVPSLLAILADLRRIFRDRNALIPGRKGRTRIRSSAGRLFLPQVVTEALEAASAGFGQGGALGGNKVFQP